MVLVANNKLLVEKWESTMKYGLICNCNATTLLSSFNYREEETTEGKNLHISRISHITTHEDAILSRSH